ncbi:uncharacterized protein [Spinacia oleracea]|uniref:RNase H type-1 domain-containing protein n=1 Tax=Spinacia oleracea TaxID=3562 RepID=A0ABM3RPW6_SPIOL|nr:uncharacterized protein LOC130471508 [Spinacia oleracea]
MYHNLTDKADDLDNRKSTSGYVFTFLGGAISWQSKLQKCVALSTTEAEYIAAVEASKEMLWLKRFLQELGLKQVIEEKRMKLKKIHTDKNGADVLTKIVPGSKVELCSKLAGMRLREVAKAMDAGEGFIGSGKRKRRVGTIEHGWCCKGEPGSSRWRRTDKSCTKAELLVVHRGLLIAWEEGHKKVQLSVDSEVVVKLLIERVQLHSPYFDIVRRCKELLEKADWEVTVSHCYREVNMATDWLANYGTST